MSVMKLRLQERSRPRSTLLINVALVIVSSLLLFALYQRHAAKPTTATVFQVRVPFNAGPQHVPQQPSLPLISSPELSSPPEAEADTWPLEALHPSEWTFKGVQLPKIAEGDMDLVPVCNSTFYKQHPFNIEDYERSYTPGATCSMPADLLYKIKTGKPVLITVVGGSMTQGRRCTDGKRGWTHCAWSSRLDDRLKEAFPNSNVTVNNIAMPGFSYGHWLKNGMMDGMAHADVVIIDEQVNSHQYGYDAYKQMETVDEFVFSLRDSITRQKRQTGILFLELFRTCANNGTFCEELCDPVNKGATPWRLGQMSTSIAGYNTTWHWCNRWWTTPDIERPVVRHHGLPIASYRDAAWPVLNSPRPDLPCLFNGKSHPESITHTMIGDVVTYGLIRAAYDSSMQMTDCDSQPPPTTFHQKLELVEYCPTGSAASSTGTFMTAFQETDFDAVSAGQWLWREDVPGKPGWVYDPSFTPDPSAADDVTDEDNTDSTAQQTGDPTVIWFKVRFGEKRQLQITYLRSYVGFGAAEVTIHGMEALGKFDNSTVLFTDKITGNTPDAVSVPSTDMWRHPSTPVNKRTRLVGRALPASISQGDYLVAFKPVNIETHNKFKVLGITTC